jgi:hypothetical protein
MVRVSPLLDRGDKETNRVFPGITNSIWSRVIQPSLIFVKEEIPGGGKVYTMKCWDIISHGPMYIA